MPKIAVGIVTYNRPNEFRTVAKAAAEIFDVPIIAHNDGSPQVEEYAALKKEFAGSVDLFNAPANCGVGYSKNRLLERMLESGADWLFLLEDDVVPKSPLAIDAYVEGCRRSGLHHLMFAHHGPANAGLPVSWDWTNGIEFYLHCVGAWTVYTRECLEKVGLMDETFKNAWEHVEHTHRIAKAGMTAPFWNFPDVVGSKEYLDELGMENTPVACLAKEGHQDRVLQGLLYWEAKDPEHFPLRKMLHR